MRQLARGNETLEKKNGAEMRKTRVTGTGLARVNVGILRPVLCWCVLSVRLYRTTDPFRPFVGEAALVEVIGPLCPLSPW